MQPKLLWTSDCQTLLDAAQEFARRYWETPRLVEKKRNMPDDSMQFGVENGSGTYEARRFNGRIVVSRLA